MITTHSIADYRTALYAFLSSPSIEGFRQDPYFDKPQGFVTIGVGFNIEGDPNVLLYVLNQLGVFAEQSDEVILTRRDVFRDILRNAPNFDELGLINQLNAKLRDYLGADTTTLFRLDPTDPNQPQSRAVFNQILGDPTTGTTTIGQSITRDGKQKELDAILGNVLGGPTAHNTKEYEALMSLLYNQRSSNPLIGPNTKLLGAL